MKRVEINEDVIFKVSNIFVDGDEVVQFHTNIVTMMIVLNETQVEKEKCESNLNKAKFTIVQFVEIAKFFRENAEPVNALLKLFDQLLEETPESL